MQNILYTNNAKIYCNDYMEIYIPKIYFEENIAFSKGVMIETLGILYTKAWKNGKEGNMRLFNLPVIIDLMVYESTEEVIKVHDKSLEVVTLKYLKDSYVMQQSITKGRDVASLFLNSMLSGNLPNTLRYDNIIDMWWKNLEIAGVSFGVPSKIFEMIIASIYRNPHNKKQRYGQLYGKQPNPSGYDYKTENVRNVVKNLSTFSGMVFEDIGNMISNGISNSIEGIEEPESPLEKIIHY